MAKQEADNSFITKGLSAIAGLRKVDRSARANISTDEINAQMVHSDRFEKTFEKTTRETLQEQAKSEVRAVTPKQTRKRQKVRPERLSYRALEGTKAIVMAAAAERGTNEATVGFEEVIRFYAEAKGLPIPGGDDDA